MILMLKPLAFFEKLTEGRITSIVYKHFLDACGYTN